MLGWNLWSTTEPTCAAGGYVTVPRRPMSVRNRDGPAYAESGASVVNLASFLARDAVLHVLCEARGSLTALSDLSFCPDRAWSRASLPLMIQDRYNYRSQAEPIRGSPIVRQLSVALKAKCSTRVLAAGLAALLNN